METRGCDKREGGLTGRRTCVHRIMLMVFSKGATFSEYYHDRVDAYKCVNIVAVAFVELSMVLEVD